jgi:hypothetical protein
MSFHAKGATNAGATGLITTRKQFGTNKNATDADTVKYGNQDINLKHAEAMALVENVAGTYGTITQPVAATRVNS